MLTTAQIVTDIKSNWILYLSMPFIAMAVGFFTKIVAINMMFKPLDFVGKKPFLGWQGIIPRKASIMAGIACDTMTTKLLSPEDIFDRLDPVIIAREMEAPVLAAIEDITREVATHYAPGLWEAAPDSLKQKIINRIKDDAPNIVISIMDDVKANLSTVFDLKDMVVSSLLRDKELLNTIFQEAGRGEFRFIRNSGAYFGFAIGMVQLVAWSLTHSPMIMPLFGLFTGWFTDWLALKMIFNPKLPKRYFGFFTWQGLFLKRRLEVSAEYGRLIAKEIVTPHNIIDAILRGPLSDRLYSMVEKHVRLIIDEQAGRAKPLVVFAVGSSRYQEMKALVVQKIMLRLPETLQKIERYADEAMDLENTLATRMQKLSLEEFEELLHPAFEQDEWILIMVGATLGFMVGELQVLLMEHLAKH